MMVTCDFFFFWKDTVWYIVYDVVHASFQAARYFLSLWLPVVDEKKKRGKGFKCFLFILLYTMAPSEC